MEQEKLEKCVDRIIDFSDEIHAAIEGLELLHGQGERLVADFGNITIGKALSREEIHEHIKNMFTWFDLMRITLNHAKDNNRFIQETTMEIQTNGFKDLSVIQGGQAPTFKMKPFFKLLVMNRGAWEAN